MYKTWALPFLSGEMKPVVGMPNGRGAWGRRLSVGSEARDPNVCAACEEPGACMRSEGTLDPLPEHAVKRPAAAATIPRRLKKANISSFL